MTRALIFAALLVLAGCGGPYCDENSPSVSNARALSQDELSQIHAFMSASNGPRRGKVYEFANAPKVLVALNPVVIDRAEGNIYLETCSIDYKVLLQVDNPYDTERFVRLLWGGWRPDEGGSEILWQGAPQK